MITERQWFQEGDFLRNLFDAIPSLLFVVDPDVRIFHLNSAASRVLGDRNSVLMKRGGEVLHCVSSYEVPEGCGRAPSCRDCVIRNSVGKAFRGEEVYREMAKIMLKEKGTVTEVHFMVTVSSLDYRGEKVVILVLEDITNLKEYEEELRQRSIRMEAANRELEAFGYSVSHDLRAPLRRISGFIGILRDDYAGRLDDEGRDYLDRVSSASDEMTTLIDSLFDLSRMALGELKRQEVDLSALAEDVGSGLMGTCGDHVPEFAVAPGLRVEGDRQLLRIALENLIGNAFKFSSGKIDAEVEFFATEEGGLVIYCVRDNGAGFDMAYAERLLAPFQRLHSAEEFPGSGIGLATVQRIIHRHGGRIWAEGAIGKGASFFFTLWQV